MTDSRSPGVTTSGLLFFCETHDPLEMGILVQLLNDPRWLTARRVLLIVIWIILATLTHVPVPQSVQEIRISDKLVHLIAYLPLGLLLPACSIRGLTKRWICVVVIAVYGIMDELLQIPVGRTASLYDWLADLLGTSLGAALGRLFEPADSSGTSGRSLQ